MDFGFERHYQCTSLEEKGERVSRYHAKIGFVEAEDGHVVHGEVCKEKLDWLKRSLICGSNSPVNMKELSSNLPKIWKEVSQVRELVVNSVLTTFLSLGDMKVVLSSRIGACSSMFSDVRVRSEAEWGCTRNLWLECVGFPPHAWSLSNLSKIGEVLGLCYIL